LATLIPNCRAKSNPFLLIVPHEPNLRFTGHIIIPDNAKVRPRNIVRVEVSRAYDAERRSNETGLTIFIQNSCTTSDSFPIHNPKLRFAGVIVMPDYRVEVRRHDAKGRSHQDDLVILIPNSCTTSNAVPILLV
jgi:hypothetical protein